MEDSEIRIDNNVPIPTVKRYDIHRKYPFHKMKIGDSFSIKIEIENMSKKEITRIGGNLRSAVSIYIKRSNSDAKFLIRTLKINNEIRVWRIN